jgi:hypothetical protein
MIRGALIGALAVAAALSVGLLGRHFDAQDVERAVNIARAHQYGPTTRARVDAWLVAEQLGAAAEWTADMDDPLRGHVVVTLTVRDGEGPPVVRKWRVEVPTREVEPLDDPTRAFTERLALWAREP